jgi:hypothetical protein
LGSRVFLAVVEMLHVFVLGVKKPDFDVRLEGVFKGVF